VDPPPKPKPDDFAVESAKKYLDPDEVLTTLPTFAPELTGDVVTTCPSRKLGEPRIHKVKNKYLEMH
jgi:hypothetical protein